MFQNITIYHKENNKYTRYNKKASLRSTSILNRNKTGVSTSDTTLIRVFDTKVYNNTWKCNKGDVIVGKCVYDDIKEAPITELTKKYGKECVYEVASIDLFDFDDEIFEELNHVKIGAR